MNTRRVPGDSLAWRPVILPLSDIAMLIRVRDTLRGLDVGDTSRQRKELDMALSWAGPEDQPETDGDTEDEQEQPEPGPHVANPF